MSNNRLFSPLLNNDALNFIFNFFRIKGNFFFLQFIKIVVRIFEYLAFVFPIIIIFEINNNNSNVLFSRFILIFLLNVLLFCKKKKNSFYFFFWNGVIRLLVLIQVTMIDDGNEFAEFLFKRAIAFCAIICDRCKIS